MRSSGCRAGYAVLLTNDPSYWNVPAARDTVDAAFRIHEGRDISGELAWAARGRSGNGEGSGITHTAAGFLSFFLGGVFDVSCQLIRSVPVSSCCREMMKKSNNVWNHRRTALPLGTSGVR